jgi:LipL41-expression chaperone Lep
MRSPRRLLSPAGLLGMIGLSLVLSACGKKPDEEQCELLADHLVKLLEESRDKPDARIRKLAQNQRQPIIDSCVQDGTEKEVQCVLDQSSIGDVEANCK